jgi:hypothetical protein
MTGAEICQ